MIGNSFRDDMDLSNLGVKAWHKRLNFYTLLHIAATKGVIVAVGGDSKYAKSIDNGDTWTTGTLPNNEGVLEASLVAADNGNFIVCQREDNSQFGYYNFYISNYTETAWTKCSWLYTSEVVDATLLDVAISGDTIAYIKWRKGYPTDLHFTIGSISAQTVRTDHTPIGVQGDARIAGGNGQFVAIVKGTSKAICVDSVFPAAESSSGFTTSYSLPKTAQWSDIAACGNVFIVTVANESIIARSTDYGRTWTTIDLKNFIPGISGGFSHITVDESTGVFTIIDAKKSACSNDNGLTWTKVDMPNNAATEIKGIASTNDRCAAIFCNTKFSYASESFISVLKDIDNSTIAEITNRMNDSNYVAGFYTGTGTFGTTTGKETRINFGRPVSCVIVTRYDGGQEALIAIPYQRIGGIPSTYNPTISWDISRTYINIRHASNASYQFNQSGVKYNYIAIGTP